MARRAKGASLSSYVPFAETTNKGLRAVKVGEYFQTPSGKYRKINGKKYQKVT